LPAWFLLFLRLLPVSVAGTRDRDDRARTKRTCCERARQWPRETDPRRTPPPVARETRHRCHWPTDPPGETARAQWGTRDDHAGGRASPL